MCFRMISNTAAARETRGVGSCEPDRRRTPGVLKAREGGPQRNTSTLREAHHRDAFSVNTRMCCQQLQRAVRIDDATPGRNSVSSGTDLPNVSAGEAVDEKRGNSKARQLSRPAVGSGSKAGTAVDEYHGGDTLGARRRQA